MDIVFILIPIALILLVTVDISKAVVTGDEGAQKNLLILDWKEFYMLL